MSFSLLMFEINKGLKECSYSQRHDFIGDQEEEQMEV